MNVTTLNIKGNELTIKDSSLTSTVDEIVSAMATNNRVVADRINNLDSRAFDYNLKIINNDESVIDNVRDGLYSIKYFSVVGEGDEAVETLNNSAILIQTGTNQYRYKDGQLSSRTKTNDTWGNWMTFEGAVTSVNSMTGAVQLKAKDVKALPDYSREYLTTVARENGTISFVISAGINTDLLTSMSYSTNGGNTWTTTNNTDNKAEDIQIDVNVSEGDEVMWKGIGLALSNADNNAISSFITNIPIDVEGNIMSLLYGDNFIGQTSLPNVGSNFYELFGSDINSGADVVDAKNMILPATTLANICYGGMFDSCTSLTQAPILPATTLASSCYSYMFSSCTSLIQAPALPATALAGYCYANMFQGCTSLTQAPALPATTLTKLCYSGMFMYCISLTQVPALPATTLADYCYLRMFEGCTSLIQAPSLPTMTLANGCYDRMFEDCTSLIQAPALPATTLTESCYRGMFEDCTSLTQAPALPATILANKCYMDMFNGCTNLTSIICLATNISATWATYNWLSGVAAIGTFVKADSMTSWTNGASGIPNGWTVVDYITPARYLTFKAESNNSSFGLKKIATGHKVYYSKDLENWKLFDTEEDVTINAGEEVYVIGDSNGVTFEITNKTTFRMEGSIAVTGDITSILDYKTLDEKISSKCYYEMFRDCTSLTHAPALPATTLANYCYSYMFQGCTSLTQAPTLPAMTLTNSCYESMFSGCTSLTQPPTLPATSLVHGCYWGMFINCTSLVQAPILPATTLADYCYASMFRSCTSLTDAPALPATTLANNCYYKMFSGCTSLTQAPTLPAITLANSCYREMFYGCTNLSSITCLATDISATNSTVDWLYRVAAKGTFITADSMTSWPIGDSGIPYGWNVYTESEYEVVRRYELINGITHTFYKNIVDNTISDKIKIWIDDFSSDISVEEMYDNYLNENAKHKQYHLTQDTITIDDITYYIWEGTHDDTQYDYDAHRAYILTTTNDYDELLSQSLSEDLNNNFTSFGGFLDEDSEESYIDENNNMQYILSVEQDNEDLYLYVDNIQLDGFDDGETISDYVNDPEGSGCNPYELTSDTIEIDGESYYIWERNDDVDDGQYDNIRYLLTTTIDRATLESTSVEASKYNLVVKQNNCIYGLMDADNEMYDIESKNVIVKVE